MKHAEKQEKWSPKKQSKNQNQKGTHRYWNYQDLM